MTKLKIISAKFIKPIEFLTSLKLDRTSSQDKINSRSLNLRFVIYLAHFAKRRRIKILFQCRIMTLLHTQDVSLIANGRIYNSLLCLKKNSRWPLKRLEP